jgi:hypothetical protein
MFKVEAIKSKIIIFELVLVFFYSFELESVSRSIFEYLGRFLSNMNEIMTDVNQIISQVFTV